MPDLAAAKILVADDDQSLVRTLMWILKENGYEVVVAPGGEGLMGKLEAERPHLLLLDIMMPKVDGLQLLAKMKADERFRDLPVLMISSMPPEEATVKSLGLGAADFIAKPFRVRELLARVKAHIRTAQELSRARDEAQSRAAIVDILHEVTDSLKPDEIYHILVRRVARVLQISKCSMVLAKAGEQLGVVVAAYENPMLRNLQIELARYPEIERALDLGVAGQLDLQVAQHRILVRGHHDPQLLARLREHHGALGDLEHARDAPHQDVVDLVRLERVRDLVQDVDDRRATLRLIARPRELLGGADVRFDAGEQLAHTERLGDEVGGAQAKRLDRRFLGRHRRDHQDRKVAEPLVGLHLGQELEAVHLGHHDVEQQQVGAFLLELPHEPLATGRDDDLVAVLLEDPHERADQRLVVVGDEDLGRGTVGHLLSPREARDRRCRRSRRAPWAAPAGRHRTGAPRSWPRRTARPRYGTAARENVPPRAVRHLRRGPLPRDGRAGGRGARRGCPRR